MFWFHHKSHADSFRKIAVSFFILTLLLLAVVFYISFAWATITITPKSVPLSEGFVMDVVDTPAQQLLVGQIEGRIIEQDFEVKGTFNPTGETVQAVEKARGAITIINQSKKNQQLRATTRLQAPDGTLFRTLEFAMVPAGGQVDVSVIADAEGVLGDLTSTRFVLPGLHVTQQPLIYGVGFSLGATSASDKKLVMQTDLDTAQASLEQEVKQKASDALQAMNSITLTSPVFVITSTPTKITNTVNLGEKVSQFTMKMTAHVVAVAYDKDALKTAVVKQLLAKLGPGYDLLPPTNTDISVTVDAIDAAKRTASLKIVAQAGRIRNADSADFDKGNLSGLSAGSIDAYFRAFDDVSDVKVQFTPFWVTSAPYLIDHIHILVKK
ncbi:MAG: hypothetical protein Q7S47_00190 [bacterium]|nr:hypothetical protein [bacterium]